MRPLRNYTRRDHTFVLIQPCIPDIPVIRFTGKHPMPGGKNERNYSGEESLYDRRFFFRLPINGRCTIIILIGIAFILRIVRCVEVLKSLVAGLISRSDEWFLGGIVRCHFVDAILMMVQTSSGHVWHCDDAGFDFSAKRWVSGGVNVIGFWIFSGKLKSYSYSAVGGCGIWNVKTNLLPILSSFLVLLVSQMIVQIYFVQIYIRRNSAAVGRILLRCWMLCAEYVFVCLIHNIVFDFCCTA